MGDLPVAVIGAGPVGLAAAAHLLESGLEPLVFEAGDGPAHAISQWGHVRLFSAWDELVDRACVRLLEPTGWTMPAAGYPSGSEWITAYLRPLAGLLAGHIRYQARVTGVSRRGRDRLVDAGRAGQPFTIHVQATTGEESRLEARAVIDASGTWFRPGPAGADGLPALGERAAAGVLRYQMPDLTQQAAAFAGQHAVVVGSGHSALTAICGLARIVQASPGTRVSWVLRRASVGDTYGGGAADQLPERGALGTQARKAVDAGFISMVTGFRVEQIRRTSQGTVLVSEDGRTLPPADQVVVLTGFRPDLSFLSELRLELDPALQAPTRIASEIDPNLHSCGTATASGATQLAHPEPDLYLAGMKSYGRAPTFLAMTGYEQVRSIAAELAGDHEAAARVDLVLPDTGVCGGSGLFDETGQAANENCCSPAPVLLSPSLLAIGRPTASAG
jgi:thioredoxin reductase